MLFEAPGIKSLRLSSDPIGSAIQDPELRRWITAENINSLPVILQRFIAATIRDYIERKQISPVVIDHAISIAKEQANEALLKAAANPEANPDYHKQIKARLDTPEEVVNFIRRLKAGAFAVASGLALPAGGKAICFFWPKAAPDIKENFRKLEAFFRKGSNDRWEADVLVNWMHSLPDNAVTGNTMNPTDQTIIRMDLVFTRGDGEKAKIDFWFDGRSQFELLKTIYHSENIVLIPEAFRFNMNVTGIPPVALNNVTLDGLGKYLASFARLNKLDEPGLVAKYPPEPPRKVVLPEETDNDERPDKNILAQTKFVKA